MYLTHPLGITLSQVIIDRDYAYTLAFKRIKICGKGRYQGLTFTGTHLGDTSLMEHDATYELHTEMFHVKDTSAGFPYRSVCLGKELVKSLALGKALLVFRSLCPELFIGKSHHGIPVALNLIHDRFDTLKLPIGMCTKDLVDQICHILILHCLFFAVKDS